MDSLLVLLIVLLSVWFAGVIARANRRLDVLERSHETLERLVRTADIPVSVVPPVAPEVQPIPLVPQPAQVKVAQAVQVPIKAPAPRELAPATAAAVLRQPAFEPQLPQTPGKPETDLERVIAGSWLNRIGIVALLIAMAFFLKLAIDKNWIGPIVQIGIGLVAGLGLLGYSHLLFKKGYGYFSEGMVALGGGVLYLSLFAGWNLYHLIPVPVAFVGMVLVTSTVLGISLARDSQRLAFLAMVGGFATPLLLNTGTDNEVGLFSYLAILNAGLLGVAYVRDWRSLPVAFLFTLAYAWGWYDLYYEPHKLAITAFFAMLFYVEFGVLPVVSARRTGNLPNEQMPMALFNATWFTFAATDMLYEHHRLTLAALMLALSAAHFIVARIAKAHEPPTARVVYDAMCFTFLAIAIGVGLRAPWIAIGWSVQGTALVLAGLRGRSRVLRIEGLVLFALVVTRLAMVPHEPGRFIFNGEFGTFAVIIGCIGYAAYRA
jgi:uncharacterized membrane protein